MSKFVSDGDRAVWDEMQRDAAPDCKVLKSAVSVARKGHELDCGCFVLPGERYRSIALLEDGAFIRWKEHATWEECRLNGDTKALERFNAEHQRRSDDYAALMNAEQAQDKEAP